MIARLMIFLVTAVMIFLPAGAQAQTVTSVSVEPVNPKINVGDVQQFRAVGTLSDGTTRVLSPSPSPFGTSGYAHTCAVLTDGRVKCWGYNRNGELGIGPPPPDQSYSPVFVSWIDTALTVSGGIRHSCAVLSDGSVKCWGYNDRGQFGNNSTGGASTPVSVIGINTAAEAAAGQYHSCALFSDGTVKCWGENNDGQLGNGTRTDSLVPVSVSGINTATAIAAGNSHNCALLSNGTVRCWGDNSFGNLGNGSTITRSLVPVSVSGINTAIAISAAGEHTCALLSDGSGRCWGDGVTGSLGNGATNNSNTPVSVSGINNAVAMALGYLHGCALFSDGTMKCWGYNAYGELGDGTTTDSSVPVSVNGINTAVAIAVSGWSTCALLSDGTARCWGSGEYGLLGDGMGSDSTVPVTVKDLSIRWNAEFLDNVTGITTGGAFACSSLSGGTVECWGNNISSEPEPVSGISTAGDIDAGGGHVCAALSDGTVKCWGENNDGQLGSGDTSGSSEPVSVSGIAAASKVAAGGSHSCAVLSGGTVECWGDNFRGQLGTDPASGPELCGSYPGLPCSTTPVTVDGINNASEVTAGSAHSCAVLSNGTIKCWGYNVQGELGDGTTDTTFSPVSVSGIDNAVSITAGSFHTCALLSNGDVKCWGENDSGQLGSDNTGPESCDANPSVPCSRIPLSVNGVSNAIAIAAGDDNTCALISGDTVKCWGRNLGGQLGNGTTIESYTPVTVNGINNAVAIDAGGTACAVLSDGAVKCWGWNGPSGMLGIGTTEGPEMCTNPNYNPPVDFSCSTNPVQVILDTAGSVIWSSSNIAVAMINNRGLATGLDDGVSTITATLGRLSGSTTLTVGTVFPLTVIKNGTGSGVVTSLDPPGINCGADCEEVYGDGTEVAFSIRADDDSALTGWDCGALVIMNEPKTCTVTFTRKPLLSIYVFPEIVDIGIIRTRYGTGRVTSTSDAGIDCGQDCSERYMEGTRVTLEATPDQGSLFGQWSAECPDGVVNMGAEDVTCTVRFDRQGYRLNIQRDAQSSVSSEDGWINCGADCGDTYDSGAEVRLTVRPTFPNQGIVTLSGDPGCDNSLPGGIVVLDSVVVTMDADKTCTATFTSFEDLFEDLQFDQMLMLRNESQKTPEFRLEFGIPRFISMRVPIPAALPDDPVIQALDFLDRYKYLYRINKPKNDLYLKRIKTNQFDQVGGGSPDPADRHLFFGQQKDGIPVHGATLAVHMKGNIITSTSGNYLTDLPDFTIPAVQSSAAEAIALADVRGANKKVVGVTKLFYYNRGLTAVGGGTPDPSESPTKLAWRIMVRGLRNSDGAGTSWRLFIDAQDGKVLSKIDEMRESDANKDFDIQSANNTESDNCWARTDAAGTADWFDETGATANYPGLAGDAFGDGQRAWNFAHLTYNYYFNNFHHHSWNVSEEEDGLLPEAEVEVWVHVGNNWDNASYSASCDFLRFGEGYMGTDTFTHEFTHAVTRWSSNMEYENQSGALDESYSDVMAALLDGDWLEGEENPNRGEDGTAGGFRGGSVGDGNAERDSQCGNGVDDDGDGFIDEACPETGAQCGDGIDNEADGTNDVDEGCPETGNQCANLIDDDGDGFIDEGCPGSCQDGIDNGLTGESDSSDTNCFNRDLADPERKGDPDHRIGSRSGDGIGLRILGFDEAVNCDRDDPGFNDCGYVHTNSGIPNKAAYLLAVGGVHTGSGIEVIGITPEKVMRLYYDVLINRLHTDSQFYDARDATIEQAQEYVDNGEYEFIQSDVCSVMNAFAAVGYGNSDIDCDGVPDNADEDNDGDGITDGNDNCPGVANTFQENMDGDEFGDRCDTDIDNDGIDDASDDCLSLFADADCDGVPDNGGVNMCRSGNTVNCDDNCPATPNPDQSDNDLDGLGDTCDPDDDADGTSDDTDNCPLIRNVFQENSDGDVFGDACDNCDSDDNPDQADMDDDNIGDVCDPDRDGDGEPNPYDSCPDDVNSGWDFDGNDMDFICDPGEAFMLSGNFGDFFNGKLEFPNLTDSINIPVFPCIDDGCPDWIDENYTTEVSLSLPAGMQARIVDDKGFVISKGTAGMTKTMRFRPAADSFFRFQSAFSEGASNVQRSVFSSQQSAQTIAFNGRNYFVEIYPSADVIPGQQYSFSIRVQSRLITLLDIDNDGYPIPADCDDNNPAINPGAYEVCDNADNNCNGQIDEGVTQTWYRDGDNDGYSNGFTTESCDQPEGFKKDWQLIALSGDCDDTNAAINQGMTEVCEDGTDNDCDGDVDASDSDCTNVLTLSGENVIVRPIDPTTGTIPAAINFSIVTGAGTTSVITGGTGPFPPAGFRPGNPAVYYEIATTAAYSGQIQVCINYSGISFLNESAVKLFHYENGSWLDVTSSLDAVNNIICGNVSSLSPFAIFEQITVNLPDLAGQWTSLNVKQVETVNGIRWGMHGNLSVKNQGNVNAGAFVIKFYFVPSTGGSPHYLIQEKISRLHAGETANISFRRLYGFNPSGKGAIRAVLDANNAIDEGNEGNNDVIRSIP